MRSIGIRLYPNDRQKEKLRQWLGCARVVYNAVVDEFVNDGPLKYGKLKDFRALRKDRIASGQWGFMVGVPYDVLDEALKEAIQARALVLTRNREARREGLPANHRLSFRSKKQPTQTIDIRARNFRPGVTFYRSRLHTYTMTARHPPRSLLARAQYHPPHYRPKDHPVAIPFSTATHP
jgi:hypothetical protein